MKYTAVIRTLGTAGAFYQRTLDSLSVQTIKPCAIIVYIAEDYPLPKETIGIEQYIYVKKGMVAQRALSYREVKTEYILFLDDDVYLPPNGVETLFKQLTEYNGDVIAPSLFDNHLVSFKRKLLLFLQGKEVARLGDKKWGYKVLRTGGFSYNNNPVKPVYESTSNAGPCFFCRKEDFLKIRYEEELWLDKTPYAFPDDQIMFYKMHLYGLKILTSFNSGIIHLDAGTTMQGDNEKFLKSVYSEYRNKTIFWYKFIYSLEKNYWGILCDILSFSHFYVLSLLLAILKGKFKTVKTMNKAISDALNEINHKFKDEEL